MYGKDMVNLGFVKIGDLITANIFLLVQYLFTNQSRKKIFPYEYKNSITTEKRSIIETSLDLTIADPIQSILTIKTVGSNVVPVLHISPKQIY